VGEVRLTVLAVTEDEVILGISRPAGADGPDLPRCDPLVYFALTAFAGSN
jgi:hypothetical protein